MNPQDSSQMPLYPTSPHAAPAPVNNPLSVMQTGEQVICEIKRHPIGILAVFILCGFLLILALVMAIAAPHFVSTSNQRQVLLLGLMIYLAFAALIVAFVFIANKVYWGNRWILTSDSLTQVTQTSLFDKQSSQLSLGNLEDVTAEQSGILPHMFDYGVIKVETAGERSKFLFVYCPRPTFYAQQILNARERFEQTRRGADPQPLYRGEGSYQQPEPAAVPSAQPQPPYGAYIPPAPAQPTQPPYPNPPTDGGTNVNTQ